MLLLIEKVKRKYLGSQQNIENLKRQTDVIYNELPKQDQKMFSFLKYGKYGNVL